MASVLFPIPSLDFDPTEIAVSWRVLTRMGHSVRFATPDGAPGAADPIMLDGIGLDPWSRAPGLRKLRLIGLLLRANTEARDAYAEMSRDAVFRGPERWDAVAGPGCCSAAATAPGACAPISKARSCRRWW
jgi:putative intracellular protease/amidase